MPLQGAAAAELAELRRANERLTRQLATLQASDTKNDDDMDEEEEDQTTNRDERIKMLEGGIKTVADIFGESSPEYRAKREELDRLLRSRREGKPLKAQLQHVDRRIERQKQRAERLEARAKELQEQITELQSEADTVVRDIDEAKTGLSDLEEERRALLLREAQQQEGNQRAAGAAAAAAPPSEEEVWNAMEESIGKRTNLPGVPA